MGNKERCKERYNYLKKNKICVRCGSEEALPNRILCYECNEKNNKSSKKYKETKEDKREYYKEYYKQKRQKAGKEGICIRCFRRKSIPGSKQCIECKEHARKTYLEKKLKSKITKTEEKEYLNKCRICGAEEVVKDKKVCINCYQYLIKNISKATKKATEKNKSHYWRKENNLISKKRIV